MPIKLAWLSIKRYKYRAISHTPCFPAWRARLARRPGRTLPAVYAAELRCCTLAKLEDFLGPFLVGLPGLAPPRAGASERP